MKKVFIAGHKGMVGSAILRRLETQADISIVTAEKSELDLSEQSQVREFFKTQNIDQVYLAAAKVGGIHANNVYPADFIYQNLMIECNIINAAYERGVDRLLFLGSSCIYPKMADQPMVETALLTGQLEPTNEPYAIAKIAGIKLCESFNRQHGTDFRSLMPTNLYGPNDNYHPENSHVIPALMRRFHEAKQNRDAEVTVWGSGNAKREFLHVDDLASAAEHMMNLEKDVYAKLTLPMLSHVNVGTGIDLSIRELAETVKNVTGYEGRIEFDSSKPDGTPRKLLDVSLLRNLGWNAKYDLKNGLTHTYESFLQTRA